MKNLKETATATTVAKVNNTEILVVENGEKRIAIKPICEALGISHKPQIERLKNDPLIGSTVTLSMTVGADEKQREMVTIPFKFVFGWLFRIDSRNVKSEAKQAVERYQLECYNALFNHFNGYAEYVEQKQQLIEQQLEVVEEAKSNFKNTKSTLDDANAQLKRIRQLTFADYDAEKRQLRMFSDEQMEG
ncbi:phage antirepressor N-terminal domain-containing protein [uncultured Draconibacterium sp.]|uniref:phage antirepressor N-terminal domain-containing protein n=1 Tax=uncultured Draconibacterium sp. TaxID=1573823 RepID=UPI0029C90FA7|nr:phage antirepressor N-terminal domain-containing protein [uncultured Draconibacterium sp.]